VVLLVGMAVGIDYSLFYLRREREERRRREPGRGAADRGRHLRAGHRRVRLTVMISLAGLFLTGIDVFTGIAVGTITWSGWPCIGS
jgi:RND superfamily putative drug exporter